MTDPKARERAQQWINTWLTTPSVVPSNATAREDDLTELLLQVQAEAKLKEHDYLCTPCFNAVYVKAEDQRCGRGAKLKAQAGAEGGSDG